MLCKYNHFSSNLPLIVVLLYNSLNHNVLKIKGPAFSAEPFSYLFDYQLIVQKDNDKLMEILCGESLEFRLIYNMASTGKLRPHLYAYADGPEIAGK